MQHKMLFTFTVYSRDISAYSAIEMHANFRAALVHHQSMASSYSESPLRMYTDQAAVHDMSSSTWICQ